MITFEIRITVAAYVCVLGFMVSQTRAVLIDDFEEGPFSIAAFTNVTANQPGLSPASVINGFRGSTFEAGTDTGVTVSLSVNDAQDDSAKMYVPANKRGIWIAGYLETFHPNPVSVTGDADLTADGHNSISVTVSEAPSSGARLLVFMFTDPIPGQRAYMERTISGPGTYLLPYSNLIPYNGETVPDFHDIDGLRVNMIATAGAQPVTVGVTEIRTAVFPEPTSACALLLLSPFIGRRKRRA